MLVPRHIAIIMDGNNRWAKERGLPRIQGHRQGVESIRKLIESALELGIEYITLYAFSTENWRRPKEEVDSLMNLLREFLNKESDEINKKDVRFVVIGGKEGIPQDILEKIQNVTEKTGRNNKLKLIIAFNYSSRTEIVDAAKRIAIDTADKKITAGDVNEELFSRYLYTNGIPDPDLFIRTSGEMRLSNFLLWQLSYAELWVTPVYWPDFRKEHLVQAIEEFNNRERRYGGRVNVS